jgi:hypothetical protein
VSNRGGIFNRSLLNNGHLVKKKKKFFLLSDGAKIRNYILVWSTCVTEIFMKEISARMVLGEN